MKPPALLTPDDPNDRFGVSAEAIKRVFTEHLRAGVIRCGCYVPTREEVANRPLDWIVPVLTDWFWESPTELAPDEGQVTAVIAVLKSRPDADDERVKAVIADAPP